MLMADRLCGGRAVCRKREAAVDQRTSQAEERTLEQRLAWLWTFWKQCLVREFCWRSWPLAVLWIVPLAMVLGAGPGFGMPKLFWGGRGLREAFVSGVALLALFVWMAYCGFVLDWTSRDSPMRKQIAGPRGMYRRKLAFGLYLLAMGFWFAVMLLAGAGFREVGRFLSSHASTLLYVAGPLAVVMIGAGVWLWRKSRAARRRNAAARARAEAVREEARFRPEFVWMPAVFLGVLWTVRALGGLLLVRDPDLSRIAKVGWEVRNAEMVSVLAWSIAALAVAAIAWRRLPPERSAKFEIEWARAYREHQETGHAPDTHPEPNDRGALWSMRWALAGLAVLLIGYTLLPIPMNAAVSICMFVMGAAAVLVVGKAYVGLSWIVMIAMAVGLRAFGGAVAGSVAPPSGLPSLAEYYQGDPRSVMDPTETAANGRSPAQAVPAASQKRPLIVVCASGGGISAAAWTMSVLTRLEELNGEFPYSVRIITGASGGMLGAAYYVGTLRSRPEPGQVGVGEPLHMNADRADLGRRDLVNAITGDSLSRVAFTMLLNDIPDGVTPWGSMYDRGRALESAWLRNTGGGLSRTFEELRADELAWRRPSLLFSPMMVEDGRRLLISNLSLDGMSATTNSRDGVDFFGLYPGARAKMSLATAARLSAGFPFVSPAPVLPFKERRRAVDAGYFDNHGTELACRWLHVNSAWVDEHASAVMMLHIRTYRREEAAEEKGGLGSAFSELSAPLRGLMSGRSAMMEFRNDRQVEQLQEEYFALGLPPVRAITVQCPLDDLPLTWMLSKAEIESILTAPETDPGVSVQLQSVAGWLSGGEARPWKQDRAIDRFVRGEPERLSDGRLRTVHRLRFAISEGEISSWMLYKPGVEFDGFEVALMHEVTRRIGQKIGLDPGDVEPERIGPVAWEQLLELPGRDVADLVVSSISFAPEREHNYGLRFTVPYHDTAQVAVWKGRAATGGPGAAMPPLRGRIAVQEDTTSAKLLGAMFESGRLKPGEAVKIEVESLAEIVGRLVSEREDRRVDFVLTDEPYALLLNSILDIDENADDRIRWAPLPAELTQGLRDAVHQQREYYCMGVAEDCPQLLWLINTVMTDMRRDGTMARLQDAYQKNAAKWLRDGKWRVKEAIDAARPDYGAE